MLVSFIASGKTTTAFRSIVRLCEEETLENGRVLLTDSSCKISSRYQEALIEYIREEGGNEEERESVFDFELVWEMAATFSLVRCRLFETQNVYAFMHGYLRWVQFFYGRKEEGRWRREERDGGTQWMSELLGAPWERHRWSTVYRMMATRRFELVCLLLQRLLLDRTEFGLKYAEIIEFLLERLADAPSPHRAIHQPESLSEWNRMNGRLLEERLMMAEWPIVLQPLALIMLGRWRGIADTLEWQESFGAALYFRDEPLSWREVETLSSKFQQAEFKGNFTPLLLAILHGDGSEVDSLLFRLGKQDMRCCWFAAHLGHLLACSAFLPKNSTTHKSLIHDYVKALHTMDPSLWRIAAQYSALCGEEEREGLFREILMSTSKISQDLFQQAIIYCKSLKQTSLAQEIQEAAIIQALSNEDYTLSIRISLQSGLALLLLKSCSLALRKFEQTLELPVDCRDEAIRGSRDGSVRVIVDIWGFLQLYQGNQHREALQVLLSSLLPNPELPRFLFTWIAQNFLSIYKSIGPEHVASVLSKGTLSKLLAILDASTLPKDLEYELRTILARLTVWIL